MTADAKGNDLNEVDVPVTGQIAIAPYDAKNVLTSVMGGGKAVTWPTPNPYLWLGLIKKDGGFSESQDKGDATEFYQQGYQLNADPGMNIKVGLAEFNTVVRKLITGQDPDENGMVSIDTYTPDTKWLVFTEEVFKNGKVRRRNGVVQVDTTEVDQSTRGDVQGRDVTLKWQPDEMIGNGSTTKFNEWVIDTNTVVQVPAQQDESFVPVDAIALSPMSLDLKPGETEALTAETAPTDATYQNLLWNSSDPNVATVDANGLVTAVTAGTANITATSQDGGKNVSCTVTVTE